MRTRRAGWVALAAVVGPGILAGLSDDDPAGIATYSILGADYGYSLLWLLVVSTAALILFHQLGARMGVVTGQGLAGLIRDRYGVRRALLGVTALVVANIGTTCAEFAGIAAGLELGGITRYLSVPAAAIAVSVLVLKGSFNRVEKVLLALSTVFVAYVISGFLAGPDWGATARGLVVPSLPAGRDAILAATATVGTTLAPWGLAFIQSYAADKKIAPRDLFYERIDVAVGAILTGVIGVFVAIACAATLYAGGRSIDDAGDAALALEPLAGGLAATLFAVGLLGAGLLAAAVLPLATAYSVSEVLGYEARLNDPWREAPFFYGTYGFVVLAAAALVLVPGAPLIPILFLSQALNAILLVPLLWFIYGICRDRDLMGEYAIGRAESAAALVCILLLTACVVALGVATIG